VTDGRHRWLVGGLIALIGPLLAIFLTIIPSEDPYKLLPWLGFGLLAGICLGYLGRRSVKDWRKPAMLVPIVVVIMLANKVVWSEDEPVGLSVALLAFFSLFFGTAAFFGIDLDRGSEGQRPPES
jgi:hypothetical protein